MPDPNPLASPTAAGADRLGPGAGGAGAQVLRRRAEEDGAGGGSLINKVGLGFGGWRLVTRLCKSALPDLSPPGGAREGKGIADAPPPPPLTLPPATCLLVCPLSQANQRNRAVFTFPPSPVQVGSLCRIYYNRIKGPLPANNPRLVFKVRWYCGWHCRLYCGWALPSPAVKVVGAPVQSPTTHEFITNRQSPPHNPPAPLLPLQVGLNKWESIELLAMERCDLKTEGDWWCVVSGPSPGPNGAQGTMAAAAAAADVLCGCMWAHARCCPAMHNASWKSCELGTLGNYC